MVLPGKLVNRLDATGTPAPQDAARGYSDTKGARIPIETGSSNRKETVPDAPLQFRYPFGTRITEPRSSPDCARHLDADQRQASRCGGFGPGRSKKDERLHFRSATFSLSFVPEIDREPAICRKIAIHNFKVEEPFA